MKKYAIIFSLLCSFAFTMSSSPQDMIVTKTVDNMFTLDITEYPSTGYTLELANIDSPYVYFFNHTKNFTTLQIGAPFISHWIFTLSPEMTLPHKVTIDFMQTSPAGAQTIMRYNVTINSV